MEHIIIPAVVLPAILMFFAGGITNAMSTLRTIFTSKKLTRPNYVLTFIDAILFAEVMKQLTSGSKGGLIVTVSFAFGKVFGVWLGDKLEDKIAIGVSEVQLFIKDKDKMKETADSLRDSGFSVTSFVAFGMNGEKRYVVETVLQRRELPIYYKLLGNLGIDEPTAKVKSLSSIQGKLIKKHTA